MKLSQILTITFMLCSILASQAQYTEQGTDRDPVEIPKKLNPISEKGFGSFGLGAGLNYGGLGVRCGYALANQLQGFIGAGYFFSGVGINVGADYDFASSSRAVVYVSGMAGVNAAIFVEDMPEYQDMFYGVSIGGGLKFVVNKKKNNYAQFGLTIPFRSRAYTDLIDRVKNDPDVDVIGEPGAVTINFGYHFAL